MVSGFNTDVEHRGQVFHVQTEEKGPDNPVVVTLVYCGGQIVGSREVSYGDAAELADLADDEIRLRMRQQHQVLIREIHSGRFDPPPMPYGHDFVSNRSFDELVLDYLETSIEQATAARAAQVSRVVQRLERFLNAAEHAGVEPAVEAAPPASTPIEMPAAELPAPEADVPIEPPTSPIDPIAQLEESLAARELRPRPAARRRGSRSFVVSAMLAAAAGIAVLMLVAPRMSTPPSEPMPAVPARRSAPPPAAGPEPSPVLPSAPFDDGAPTTAPAPSPEPAAPAALSGPEPITAPPVAPAPARPRSSEPRRKPESPPARVAAPAPAQASAMPQPSSPAPPTDELPDLSPTVDDPRPPEPGVRPGQIVDLTSVDVTPRPRRRDLPRYTSRARRAGQQGTVEIRVLIDEHGEVADTALVRDDAGADLAEESMSAVRAWTFSPARKDRQPVKVWQDVALEFTILPNRSTSVRIRE